MSVISDPKLIRLYSLKVLLRSVELEGMGLRFSGGTSRTAVAKRKFGLKMSAPRKEVVDRILEEINKGEKEYEGQATDKAEEHTLPLSQMLIQDNGTGEDARSLRQESDPQS